MKNGKLYSKFVSPGPEYRGKPFWSWNGELEADELKRQVAVMQEMGLGGYFMHSRAGLITEYLGDEWFDVINSTADEGERLGMESWLYDEDRWPSGSAGGKVTVDPQYRMKSLYVFESDKEKYEKSDDTYAVYAARLDGTSLYEYKEIGKDFDADDVPEGWRVLHFRVIPKPLSSNYNGTTYIDTMSYKATERFIELTHEEYKKRCGNRLGTSIKGIFTDEPHRGNMLDNTSESNDVISCAVCYTEDMFSEFKSRYGYDAEKILPEIFYRKDGKPVHKVKVDFVDLCCNLFVERFIMPINAWCIENNIEFTGHVLHEDALTCQTVPNGSLMRTYEHMGVPGIDLLSEYATPYWVVKQLTSAARQTGKKWELSELYGCTGWQFNMRSHKAVGDWQALFGINLRCQHLSWYTMEGESKRDYPASILHQSPWYHDYACVEDYFARFGLLMSEGKPCCDTLVINPIESVWALINIGWAKWISCNSAEVGEVEHDYRKMFGILAGNQIDFDYGEEQMIIDKYSVVKTENGALLRIGNAEYKAVVLGGMITVRPTTLKILEEFANAGGKVIFAGNAPAYVGAEPSDEAMELAAKCITVPFEDEALARAVNEAVGRSVSVTREGKPLGSVFAQLRDLGNGDYACVILNTDRNNPTGPITLALGIENGCGCEKWVLETGEKNGVHTYIKDGCVCLDTELYAAGSAAYIFSADIDNSPVMPVQTVVSSVTVNGEFDYTLDEEGVCVLDYASVSADGGQFSRVDEVLRIDSLVRDIYGLEHRGGEMLQPWYAKLTDSTVYGNIELKYTFNSDIAPEGDVFLCGERPEYNEYILNGVRLECPDRNDFYIDNCLKKMPVPKGVIVKGENVVTVKTRFMRTSNIEALYLIGDFGVRLDGTCRTLIPSPAKMGQGNMADYGMPFYTGSVTYKIPAKEFGKVPEGCRAYIRCDKYEGGLVKVTASGKTMRLPWEPYECDITEALEAGEDILVTLVGTRRNLFGPLHLVPLIHGAYGPGHFVTGGDSWTDNYNLIDNKLGDITVEYRK